MRFDRLAGERLVEGCGDRNHDRITHVQKGAIVRRPGCPKRAGDTLGPLLIDIVHTHEFGARRGSSLLRMVIPEHTGARDADFQLGHSFRPSSAPT